MWYAIGNVRLTIFPVDRPSMYELRLFIDSREPEVFQAESRNRLTKEVAFRFRSVDPLNEPLPFDVGIDDNGRIVKMTLDADLTSPWWRKHHPFIDSGAVSVIAIIEKINRGNGSDGFPVPADLNQGNGKAWAAIRDGSVVQLAYMNRVPDGETFAQYRQRVRSHMQANGRLVTGLVVGCRLVPTVLPLRHS